MTVAAVELWGTRIGAVALTAPMGLASFQYDPAFLASGIQLAPLMMPLADRVYSFPELAAAHLSRPAWPAGRFPARSLRRTT